MVWPDNLPLSPPISFCPEKMSAFYVCYIFSKALIRLDFHESKQIFMNSDLTAPVGNLRTYKQMRGADDKSQVVTGFAQTLKVLEYTGLS